MKHETEVEEQTDDFTVWNSLENFARLIRENWNI